MGKFWDSIGEFLGKLIPEFIKQLILKWLNAREEASLDAFAADRLQKNATEPREVASTLLRKNMALQVLALATRTAEQVKALFVTGNYGMGYLMDLTGLKLPFVVSADWGKKNVDDKEYQVLVNNSTVCLYVYQEGQEEPCDGRGWGVDPTESEALGTARGISPQWFSDELERYGRLRKETRRELKRLRAAKQLAEQIK